MGQRIGFFLLVLFFAGSIVLIAAHDLRHQRVVKQTGTDAEVNSLITALSGNPLSKIGSPEVLEAGMIPPRAPGQYLVSSDKSTINKAIRNIIPHPAEDSSNDGK